MKSSYRKGVSHDEHNQSYLNTYTLGLNYAVDEGTGETGTARLYKYLERGCSRSNLQERLSLLVGLRLAVLVAVLLVSPGSLQY